MTLFHVAVTFALLSVLLAAPLASHGQTVDANRQAPLRIAVTGESNLRSNFIESLKDAAKDNKLPLEVVSRSDPGLTYTLIIAQETTITSAAAAVVVLDKNGDVAASVVRSGRMSGRGALNACAKELVKKLLVSRRDPSRQPSLSRRSECGSRADDCQTPRLPVGAVQ